MSLPSQYCLKCQRFVCTPCERLGPANDNHPPVFTASDEALRDPVFIQSIALALATVPVRRRELRDYFVTVLIRLKGQVLAPDGSVYYDNIGECHADLVDRTFPEDEDDRWFSYAIAYAHTRPKHRTRETSLPRWRLIEIVMRLDGRI